MSSTPSSRRTCSAPPRQRSSSPASSGSDRSCSSPGCGSGTPASGRASRAPRSSATGPATSIPPPADRHASFGNAPAADAAAQPKAERRRPPSWEPDDVLLERVLGALARIHDLAPDGEVIAVTHGGVIYALEGMLGLTVRAARQPRRAGGSSVGPGWRGAPPRRPGRARRSRRAHHPVADLSPPDCHTPLGRVGAVDTLWSTEEWEHGEPAAVAHPRPPPSPRRPASRGWRSRSSAPPSAASRCRLASSTGASSCGCRSG